MQTLDSLTQKYRSKLKAESWDMAKGPSKLQGPAATVLQTIAGTRTRAGAPLAGGMPTPLNSISAPAGQGADAEGRTPPTGQADPA